MKIEKVNIYTLLRGETPELWVEAASSNLPLLLIDHAHCEKKAASTAMGLIYRYPDKAELLKKMSKLAREELLHFEQVLKILAQYEIPFENITPCAYAPKLHQFVRTHEPAKLVDTLIIGALIEARSCERFHKLSERIEPSLAHFYKKLYVAEARHFSDYLSLAYMYGKQDIEDSLQLFADKEYELITSPDPIFRFHSGLPTYSITSSGEEISRSSEPSLMESPIV